MRRIKVLLIEDNRILRDGIKAVIDAQPEMNVVAASGGNHDTLTLVRKTRPRIVLMDLGLRNKNVLHIIARVARDLPQVKVIAMGLIPSQMDIVELVEAGAAGFILKEATIDDVLGTIRSVARGGNVIPPPLTGSLFTHIIEQALRKGKVTFSDSVRMTKREREIIALIAEGLSNKDIARRINLSTFTVKSHVHNILEKLALHSRLQIATRFRG